MRSSSKENINRMSAKPVGRKAIYSNLNERYAGAADVNGSSYIESSFGKNRSATPTKAAGDERFEFRGQNRIHYDYEVHSPNISQEVVIAEQRTGQVPLARLDKTEINRSALSPNRSVETFTNHVAGNQSYEMRINSPLRGNQKEILQERSFNMRT